MISHFIWDFDGTLFDTYPQMALSLQRALETLGIQEPIRNILSHMKQSSVGAAAAACGRRHGLEVPLLMERFRANERSNKDSLLPYPGAARVCHTVCALGGRNYLYTHRNRSALDALARCGLAGCFEDAITLEGGFPRKPAPDALRFLCAKHHIPPDEALMTGDRDIDLLAAARAGIAGCLFDPDHYFDCFEPDYRVHSMDAMESLIAALLPARTEVSPGVPRKEATP